MASELPEYVTAAQPVPEEARAAWFKNTAPAYAGIFLWFVFWQDVVKGAGTPGGVLSQGILPAILGLVIAAALCHFLFYLAPGLLGMKTGRPLYVVGTSTYGVGGGLIMPGFLMGILQFGWIAVNAFAVSKLLCTCFGLPAEAPSLGHGLIASAFAILGAIVGLKGIKYVARVATFLPLIPLAVLIVLLVKTAGGLGGFEAETVIEAAKAKPVEQEANSAPSAAPKGDPGAKAELGAKAGTGAPAEPEVEPKAVEKEGMPAAPAAALASVLAIIGALSTYICGFFAPAGGAGVDFGTNSRNAKDVQLGGLTGIALATIVAGGLAILVVAGAYGQPGLVTAAKQGELNPVNLLPDLIGKGSTNTVLILLAIASFPAVCFSAFIAANSCRTTLPKVNPWLSVGCGTAVAIVLAVTGVAGQVVKVFVVMGAAFGPICGALAADYLLAGRKWPGPRAGWNLAGWVSWVVGFGVGAIGLVVPALAGKIPCPPLAAFIVGFALYAILAKVGLESRTLEMPGAPAPAPASEPAAPAEEPAE